MSGTIQLGGISRPVTDKQWEVLLFVREFTAQHGVSPSPREIQKGIPSISTAQVASKHLEALEAKGYLTIEGSVITLSRKERE